MSSGKIQNNFNIEFNTDYIFLNNGEEISVTLNNGISDLPKNVLYNKALELHLILSSSEKLSNIQKIKYCEIERGYMKLYLKSVLSSLVAK